MTGVGVLSPLHSVTYASLSYCYVLSMAAAGMAFGFAVFKSEYYGLPTFLGAIGTAAGGLFIAQSGDLNVHAKLAIAFFLPPSGFTIGIFIIEDWFYAFGETPVDLNYSFGGSRNLPSLGALQGVMIASGVCYMLLCIGMPFDWLFRREFSAADHIAEVDTTSYACDREISSSEFEGEEVLLDVRNMSHVYPDGTHAVKDISFQVRSGEILSFLGANGAGKSTAMGMLCGTLKATVGDAMVGEFSISTSTTKARRCLGICTQQDVLWPDLSVREHLMLFGLLRGTSVSLISKKVSQMVQDLGFPEKADFQSAQLSGGQKRRLCAGISMIGDNKVVFLDEVCIAVLSILGHS